MDFTNTLRDIIASVSKNDYAHLYDVKIDVPEHFNWIRDVFENIHVKADPDKTMLELVPEFGDPITMTYGEGFSKCNQLLNYLRERGVKQGDKIFVMSSLHSELWVTYLAAIKGGFVLIPAASILSDEDISYRFEKAQPAAIITDLENLEKIKDSLAHFGKPVANLILMDGESEGWTNFNKIENYSNEAETADTKSDDILFWFFTSGTTGFPKVVAHTHTSYPLGHLTTMAWIGLNKNDKHYNISQPGWAKFAWSCFFAPFNAGATVFCFKQDGRFTAHTQLEAIQNHQVTSLCCPPTALRLLIQENLKSYDFQYLRTCVSAGEPLNPEVIQAWKDGTGLILRDGYGQTESTCMAANLPGNKIKYGSMGKPTFLYDIVIADEEGNEAVDHEEGQIAVRIHPGTLSGIFREYLGAEKEQVEKAFRHGLYYTGDKAYRDHDGYIWFVGRDDDVIKSSDYRIGPFEVESALIEIPEILESAVVGSPHPIKGYEVKAFVVLKDVEKAGEELAKNIFSHCRENIAPYKMPRIIEFVTELPKTISGKIRRIELRSREAHHKMSGDKLETEFFYKH